MRRLLLSLLILPALALPAWAEKAPDAEGSPVHHSRETWQQHFAKANTAHDGHLTAAEAKSGYAQIAKHFDDIDFEHKGYVTENDLRAWKVMQKAAHRLAKPQEDKLRPRAAFQRVRPDSKTISPTSRQTMATTMVRPSANN